MLPPTPPLQGTDNNASLTNKGQDWFVEEDDLYRDDNLCTPPSGTEVWGQDIGYFACKSLKCEIRRAFTNFDIYDLHFSTTAGTTENMLIAIGHARLQMNQAG